MDTVNSTVKTKSPEESVAAARQKLAELKAEMASLYEGLAKTHDNGVQVEANQEAGDKAISEIDSILTEWAAELGVGE